MFNDITMKDICEAKKLRCRGLYLHYGNTRQIFAKIIDDLIELSYWDVSMYSNLRSIEETIPNKMVTMRKIIIWQDKQDLVTRLIRRMILTV